MQPGRLLGGRHELGENAKKKMVSFGFSRLMSTAVRMVDQTGTAAAEASGSMGERSRQVRQARCSR